MLTEKIFKKGRSQIVRLPKEYRFNEEEVMINKIGDIVVLMPKNAKWNSFIQAIDMFSVDFLKDYDDVKTSTQYKENKNML